MRLLLECGFDCFPPSVNHTYMSGRFGRRYKSREAIDFEKAVSVGMWEKRLMVNPTMRLRVEIELWSPKWMTKAGGIGRADLDNRIKALIDAVFKKLGIDDKHIFEIEARKRVGEGRKCGIKIYEIFGMSS